MATKIIKLNNGTDTYAPVTLANAVQFNTGDTPISVQEVIFSLVQMIFNVAENIPTTDDIPTMTAATASAPGTRGFVPAPTAGSQNKVLTGAATFKTISASQGAHATGLLYKTMNTTEEFTLFDDKSFTGSPVSLATIASPAITVSLKGPVFYGEVVDASQPLPTISLDDTVNTPTLDASTNMFYLDSWSNAAPTSITFDNKSNIKSINTMQIDTSNVTDMGYMFSGCSSLNSLDLSNLNTSNVTKMPWMFNHCPSLTSLDLSNFDTSKVTDMERMFYNCSSLTSLDLSSFNTSKVTDMHNMFWSCSSLKDVYITVEATLNKLTNNLTSQGYDYIPSSATIHYNGVDYKWQNNAWKPQS